MSLARVMLCTVMAVTACRGSDERAEKLQREVDELTEQLARLRAELDRREAARAEGVSPDCVRYLAMVAAYTACEKVPQEAREVAEKAARALQDTWASDVTDDARALSAGMCRSSTSALREGARTFGCPVNVEREP